MSIFSPIFWYVIAGAFVFGNVTGGSFVYKIWNVSYTHSKIESLKKDNQLFRKAAGIAAEIDDESEEAKQHNEKVVRDILAGLKRPDPVIQKEEHYVLVPFGLAVPNGKPAPSKKQNTGRPVCVTTDSMRALGSLK